VTLEISQDGASVDAGSSQGLQPGVGVYDAGLIGVVQDTGSSSSTVRMLGSDELAVRASVVYAYGDDPDNGFASLVGTVKTVGSQLVFLADSPVPSERLSLLIGADVVVAGEAGSLLHPKVPIGTIERPVSADDTSSFVLALTGSLTASHATVILPESILMD
jgi:hypothetical protein